nr:MAG TPA: hypothetical protein [Caudoviricetes sp.]
MYLFRQWLSHCCLRFYLECFTIKLLSHNKRVRSIYHALPYLKTKYLLFD